MDALVALYEARGTNTKTSQAKAKKDAKEAAGKEIRDASMKALIHHDHLTDISTLDDASVCEKQGQCKEK